MPAVNAQSFRVQRIPQPLLQRISHRAANGVRLPASTKTEPLREEDKGQIAATYLTWDIPVFRVADASIHEGMRGRIRGLVGG